MVLVSYLSGPWRDRILPMTIPLRKRTVLHSLLTWFRKQPSAPREPSPATATVASVRPPGNGPRHHGQPVPSYPDAGDAAPAVPPEVLMESQAALIGELHQASALSHENFERIVVPAIRNYAAFVHLLPGSENHHHCGPGGMFRHGLEVAYYAAFRCESAVFALDFPPSVRKRLEPRYRIACLLGGLAHDLGKPLVDVGAVDPTGERMWNPHTASLYDWLVENGIEHYYFHWRPGARHKRHEAFTTAAVHRLIPPATMAWMADHQGQVAIDAMLLALGGSTDQRNQVAAIITAADSASVAKDLADARTRLAASGQGGVRSLAARLVRTIHDQLASGEWKVNVPGGLVWVTTEGVFGMYPEIARQAIEVLRAQGDTSLPAETQSVLEVLADHGYIQPNIFPNGQTFYTWRARLHLDHRGAPTDVPVHAIRFMRDDVIPSAMIPPTPVAVTMLDSNGNPAVTVGKMPNGAPITRSIEPPSASEPAGTEEDEATQGAEAATSSKPAQRKPTKARKARQPDLLPPDPSELASDGDAMDIGGAVTMSPPPVPDETAEEVDEDDAPSEGEGGERFRDRREERDVRDLQMEETLSVTRAPGLPGTPEEAERWFIQHRPDGEFLISIAKRVRDGVLKDGRDILEKDGHAFIRYPDGFKDLGIPERELVGLLEKRGWTVRDAATPNRATVSVDVGTRPVTAVKLAAEVSSVFQKLLPAGVALAARGGKAIPWGPFIGSEVAEHLTDRKEAVADESPWVRMAFQAYLLSRESGAYPEPAQWPGAMQEFCKMHRIKVPFWIFKHLTGGANAYLEMYEEDAGSIWTGARFRLNATYRLDLDMAETGLTVEALGK